MARAQRRQDKQIGGKQDSVKGKESIDPQAEESPLSIATKKLYQFLNTRLGWPLASLLVAGVLVWQGWGSITQAPGISQVLTYLRELAPLPQASPERFSIAIARLENDTDGSHRRLIKDALISQFGKNEIEILMFDRLIAVSDSDKPQVAISKGHEQAKKLLESTNAQVIVWGEALENKPEAPIRLHWTASSNVELEKTSEKYQPVTGSYDLPQLFHDDLNSVLALLASTQAVEFSEQDGQFIVDSLKPFIERVRNLVASKTVAGVQQASLQVVLGDSLVAYGEQTGDDAALAEAQVFYQKALTVFSRDKEPKQWVETQCSLATILAMFGRREAGTAKLEQAAAMYQNVLNDYPGLSASLDWATVKNNLGAILLTIGERDGKPAKLNQALAAFQDALEEGSRERAPLDWARTQNNLGTVFMVLSAHEAGASQLEKAIEAYKLSLAERTRKRVPLDWAATQNNLGNALLALGERGSGTAMHEQAVTAYQEALKERTRERTPIKWASTQSNLGNALIALGKRESGTVNFEKAVVAVQESLKEYTRANSPLEWATSQNNLGVALTLLGIKEEGTLRLEEAVSALQDALKERTREHLPLQWAATQNNLGLALFYLGGREQAKMRLEQSVSAFEAVLQQFTRVEAPAIYDVATRGRAVAKDAVNALP